MKISQAFEWFLIGLVLLLAVGLRLYKLDNPLADWHSFRQADTASVTREYVKHGINLLVPRYHDLSNIQSGFENPNGYRMVEFPLLNGLTASIITTFSLQSNEVVVGRLVSIFFSALSVLAVYFLGKNLNNRLVGFVAALVFSLLPYSVFYGRVILPEPALISLSTLALTFFAHWLDRKNLYLYILSFTTFTLALLIKPYTLFIAPLFPILVFVKKGKPSAYIASFLLPSIGALPLLWWRNWITGFKEGLPASDWLYNKDNIRFKGAFFHWLFEVRLGTLILGIFGVVPVVLGLLKKDRSSVFYLFWVFCLFAYLSVFAGGNVQHDYYQVFLLPALALLAGRGVSFLFELPKDKLSRPLTVIILTGLLALSTFVSWYNLRGYYQINNGAIIEAGAAADRLLPDDAKVIAPYNGDTAFLFQTNRTGWPIGFYIDQKINQGATAYVGVVYDDEARTLEENYTVLEKTDRYIIIDLTQKK